MSHPTWSAQFDRSFVSIDFETATSAPYSACAVAAVVFENGAIVERHRSLIQPPRNEYDPFNISIHGITPSDTKSAATFPEVWRDLAALMQGSLVLAHNTSFDMSVLRRSSEFYDYSPDAFAFACTYRLFKSHMPDLGEWKLNVLASQFDIALEHHDPLSDAEAAGKLWLVLSQVSRMGHKDMLERHGYRLGFFHILEYLPFSNAKSSRSRPSEHHRHVAASGVDPDSRLYGKRIAVTGTLASMPRQEVFDAILDAGGTPTTSVSGKTDYLVVGSINLAIVGPSGMSTKHRKAYELQQGGHPIQIIDEDGLHCLLANEPV
ncbi:exonuclease domain-containing protein [Candidatus Poriferisodalis sp.]|uniref:exonuclease domain-containing protein n=1 Tax=Candidatus Poriferisodalis sp. TaxID=3101277 RepID=UPI003B02A116